MFKKKPIIKTLSPLRSSERRRLADTIISDYGLASTSSVADEPSIETPDKAAKTLAHSSLRNQILPESTLSAKFSTTHGPALSEVNGVVYVGSHESGDQRVLWIKLHDKLYPSVYTLWRIPGILPLLHTPSFVITKIQGGADLMIPGLAGPPFPSQTQKGSLVAIASLENPSVPTVVGTCEIDIYNLEKTQGAKGKAVDIFHCEGDHIWDWSASGKSGTSSPKSLNNWLSSDNQLSSNIETLNIDEEEPEGGVPLESTPAKVENDTQISDSSEPLTTAEIDQTFKMAFLYGLYRQREDHKSQPKYGLVFPLTQSFVISALVQPYLPAFTKQQIEGLVIKKTSWKNPKKFLKYLDKEKILLTKEQKNEVTVLAVDFDDLQVRDFVPYRLPSKQSKGVSSGHAETVNNDEDDSIGQELKVITLYRPRDSLAPLFKHAGVDAKSYYTVADIRLVINNYVTQEQLLAPHNRRLAKLDPIISNAVLSTDSAVDLEIMATGIIARDGLIDRVVHLCNSFHSILRGNEGFNPHGRPKSGAAPRIGIMLETRSGNKTATTVHGLEAFFISPQVLADELRKQCASSTSVEPYKSGKGMEIMVQGPQKDAVMKALDKRGIQKAWIDVQDKTKGKRK